jgi:subtilisin family serine protease
MTIGADQNRKAGAPTDLWSTITPDTAWTGRTGRGVSVAIIDSGVDTEHPALAGKVTESVEAVVAGGKVMFKPSTTGDAAGHGTACAGIISRIAPDASLCSIKVMGSKSSGAGEMFLAGLDYAIKRRIKIINLSLGTSKPQYFAPLHDLLDRAYQAGCVVIAAANNLPQSSYPSVFSSSIISVVMDDRNDPFDFGYRFGEVIELVAPGVNIETAWPGGGYRRLTGNSFACPQIAGIIALLMEANPELTPFQVKTILYAIASRNDALRS